MLAAGHLNPIIVFSGAGDETRHEHSASRQGNGIARHCLASAYHNPTNAVGGTVEGYDVAMSYGTAQQTAIAEERPFASSAQTIAPVVYYQHVAFLVERTESIPIDGEDAYCHGTHYEYQNDQHEEQWLPVSGLACSVGGNLEFHRLSVLGVVMMKGLI